MIKSICKVITNFIVDTLITALMIFAQFVFVTALFFIVDYLGWLPPMNSQYDRFIVILIFVLLIQNQKSLYDLFIIKGNHNETICEIIQNRKEILRDKK